FEKETLIKQGVNKKNLFRQYRNMVEHAGTTCSAMFRKCSGKPFSPEQAVALAPRGLQRFAEKTCSGMFRQCRNTTNHPAARVFTGVQAGSLEACSGCSGGAAPHTQVRTVFTP